MAHTTTYVIFIAYSACIVARWLSCLPASLCGYPRVLGKIWCVRWENMNISEESIDVLLDLYVDRQHTASAFTDWLDGKYITWRTPPKYMISFQMCIGPWFYSSAIICYFISSYQWLRDRFVRGVEVSYSTQSLCYICIVNLQQIGHRTSGCEWLYQRDVFKVIRVNL